MYRATALHFHTKSKQLTGVDWCSGVLCPGSCFIPIGGLVRVLHLLVLRFVLYIDWWSGSCFLSIDALVRVLYRLMLWFVSYICWCSGSCFISIGDVAHVLYGLVPLLELHICVFVNECYIETMLTWPCREHKKNPVKDRGAHVWKALGRGESGHDSVSLRGPTSNTHTHTHTHTHSVLCKVHYSVRMAVCKQGWAASCLYDFTAVCLKLPFFWDVTHHRVLGCRPCEWTW